MFLLCACHIPGTVLDVRDVAVKKETTDSIFCLYGIFILVEKGDNKINKKSTVY